MLGCFYVALLLLICCLIPLWLENILWFKCFLSCWCLFYDPGVVQGIVLSWGLTCPRYLKRNVYCVDKGYVAYGCQLDPVGWWCSGFLVSFSYMYIYSFISYVSLSFTSEMFDGGDVEVLEYNRICLFFLLAFPIFVSSFCNSGAYTFGHSIYSRWIDSFI